MACPPPGHLREPVLLTGRGGSGAPHAHCSRTKPLGAFSHFSRPHSPVCLSRSSNSSQSIGSLWGEAAQYLDGAISEHHPSSCPGALTSCPPPHPPRTLAPSTLPLSAGLCSPQLAGLAGCHSLFGAFLTCDFPSEKTA